MTFKIQTNFFFSIKSVTDGEIPKHDCVCYSLPTTQILRVQDLVNYILCLFPIN